MRVALVAIGLVLAGFASGGLAQGVQPAPASEPTAASKSAPAPEYRISGRVVNAETGSPLANAQVAIAPAADAREPVRGRSHRPPQGFSQFATTGADGAFVFEHLAAGKYSLSGSRRGYMTAGYQEHGIYSTAIVTGEGLDSEGLTFRLSPGGVISGTVTDNQGDPVETANVTLYRVLDDGLGQVHTYRNRQTDDLGSFEFAHLEPGTYFLGASARVWYASSLRQQEESTQPQPEASTPVNLDLVYPRTFYADATDSAGATPIEMHGAEQLRADLHMNAVPAVHLSVAMPGSGDQGAAGGENGARRSMGFQIPSLQQPVFGEMEWLGPSMGGVMILGEPGHQTATLSVAPGDYQVAAEGRTALINATSDSTLDPQAGAGSVEVAGRVGPVAGVQMQGPYMLSLYPVDRGRDSVLAASEHDGSYTFEHVSAGEYELEARSDGRPLSVVQVAASGAGVNGGVLSVASRPVAFAATLAPASSVVAGYAEQDGRPASGVMIVLVPEHPGDHLLYRRDQSDSDGSFSMRPVAAGRYTLVAIRDGWDLHWADPSVIARYLPAGMPVRVSGAATVARPEKPVPVQAR